LAQVRNETRKHTLAKFREKDPSEKILYSKRNQSDSQIPCTSGITAQVSRYAHSIIFELHLIVSPQNKLIEISHTEPHIFTDQHKERKIAKGSRRKKLAQIDRYLY